MERCLQPRGGSPLLPLNFLSPLPPTSPLRPSPLPQVIDGQQRLTTLVMLLAHLHAWAKEQGNEVLELRVRRMLYLEPDPLDPNSQGR